MEKLTIIEQIVIFSCIFEKKTEKYLEVSD